jgi:flavorubredoxin
MNTVLLVALIAVGVIFALLVLAFAAITFDASSLTATDSQTLNPSGTQAGKALVVYNPGFSGAAKAAAEKIANDFQASGYSVDLAGVKSGTACNMEKYDVVVAGGPMYFGKASSSIENYLKTLNLKDNAKLGVYVTTGSNELVSTDLASLQQQIAAVTNKPQGSFTTEMVLDDTETQNCASLVAALLQ